MTAIVILGAKVRADGPSPALLRRATHGAMLFHDGRGTRIIACGAEGDAPPSEAKAIKLHLVASDVPPGAIICEDQSRTTYENLRNANRILMELGIDNIVIVTDRYHAPRALLVAKALGLKSTSASPAPPRVAIGLRLRRILHEAIALPGYAIGLMWWVYRDR